MPPFESKFVVSFVHEYDKNFITFLTATGDREWSDSSRHRRDYEPAYAGDYNLLYVTATKTFYISEIIGRSSCDVATCRWRDRPHLLGRDHLRLAHKLYTLTRETFIEYFGDIIRGVAGTTGVPSPNHIGKTLAQYKVDQAEAAEWTLVQKAKKAKNPKRK